MREDLSGRRFGHLTVIAQAENRKERICWLCRCDCGNKKVVAARALKAGKTKSCGCRQYECGHNRVDITGQKYGKLTALYATDKRDKRGSVYWHCRCDCGTELDITAKNLAHGNYKSCGCLRRENQEKLFDRLQRIDGTCIEWLKKRKSRADNTSGFRGVYQMKSGRYSMSIGFKGKRFRISGYPSFDEAVEARLAAEHLIHDGFVEAYELWKEKAEKNPDWGIKNPLRYDVELIDGDFKVTSNIRAEYETKEELDFETADRILQNVLQSAGMPPASLEAARERVDRMRK